MNDRRQHLPAEWEYRKAVLMAWPHSATDWAYMLDEVTECYIDIVSQITRDTNVMIVAPDTSYVIRKLRGKADLSKIKAIGIRTDDTWMRDYGMICTCDSNGGDWTAHDFKFDGWGLKYRACNDNMVNTNIERLHAIDLPFEHHLSFVLEGGSIDVDEKGTLLTTEECLLSANRNGSTSKAEIERQLKDIFGVSKVIWLSHGALEGDDTDSHVDTLARFLPGDIIAYTSCDREDDSHYHELEAMRKELEEATDADGHRFRLIPLPIPEAIYDSEGNRLPATYANFLIINNTVYLPVYGDEKYDRTAIDRLTEALPDFKIVPINCRALIEQHGSLHCITMQIPDANY